MKTLFTFLLVSIALLAFSQEEKIKVKIIDGQGLYTSSLVRDDATYELTFAMYDKFGKPQTYDYLAKADESNRPEALIFKGIDEWEHAKARLGGYNAYIVGEFKDYYVILVPQDENQHMDPDMRTDHDFCFFAKKKAVSKDLAVAAVTKKQLSDYIINDEVMQSKIKLVQGWIKSPGEYYANFDLRGNEEVMKTLGAVFGSEELNQIANLAAKSSWPEGFNNGTSTASLEYQLTQYTCYVVTEFTPRYEQNEHQQMVLLYIPQRGNYSMPEYMIPPTLEGFFMVYKKEAVQYEGRTDDKEKWDALMASKREPTPSRRTTTQKPTTKTPPQPAAPQRDKAADKASVRDNLNNLNSELSVLHTLIDGIQSTDSEQSLLTYVQMLATHKDKAEGWLTATADIMQYYANPLYDKATDANVLAYLKTYVEFTTAINQWMLAFANDAGSLTNSPHVATMQKDYEALPDMYAKMSAKL